MVVTIPPKIYDSETGQLNCTICGWTGTYRTSLYLDDGSEDPAVDFNDNAYVESYVPGLPDQTQLYCPNHEGDLIVYKDVY